MPRQPVRIEFAAMPHSPAVESAARRRMRGIEAVHACVQEWSLRIQAPQCPAPGERFAVVAAARVCGGRTLSAQAYGGDALAALRLAFNGLELELEADAADARVRAAAWLASVRDRLPGWPGHP